MIPHGEEEQTGEGEATVAELEDAETLRQALAEETAKAEGHLASWQRAQADFTNYKRRAEQEREETIRFANTNLMLNLLPVLDDLERAFAAIPPRLNRLEWVDGIRLIERKLRANLEALGLSTIVALGKPFDPNFHEAVMQGRGEEGIVVAEMQKGYMLNDRVIRPTRIIVGNGEEEQEQKED